MQQIQSMFGFLGMLGGLSWLLGGVGLWRLFAREGKCAWASLVPVYRQHILYGLCWQSKMYWYQLALIGGAVTLIATDTTGMMSGIGMLMILAAMLMGICVNFKLAAAYGKSFAFGLGLTVLQPVFLLVLGCCASGSTQAAPRGRRLG